VPSEQIVRDAVADGISRGIEGRVKLLAHLCRDFESDVNQLPQVDVELGARRIVTKAAHEFFGAPSGHFRRARKLGPLPLPRPLVTPSDWPLVDAAPVDVRTRSKSMGMGALRFLG
jgi:hypothetical protein